MQARELSPHEKILNDLWEAHMKHEFDPAHKSVEKTMETMVKTPFVNHVPTMVGGNGFDHVSEFLQITLFSQIHL